MPKGTGAGRTGRMLDVGLGAAPGLTAPSRNGEVEVTAVMELLNVVETLKQQVGCTTALACPRF